MQSFVSLLAGLVRRAPALLIALVLVLTGSFAVLAQQVQIGSGNEGFAPDNPELLAAETLSERFGGSAEEVLQVLVRGDDVISADGLAAVDAVTRAVMASPRAELLSSTPQRPAIVSFLGPLQQSPQHGADSAEGGSALSPGPPLDDAAVAAAFSQALRETPPEQAAFLTGLLPSDADLEAPSADAGLILVFLDSSSLTDGEDGTDDFDAVIEAQSDIAEAIAAADLPPGFSATAFSFALLFADTDAFTSELARLFASAFGLIVLILAVVYWLRPGTGLRRLGATRRTAAEVGLTMATIVMAILWMNGIATMLGPGGLGVIGPMTEMTQIVPVLLIGLGVDYAIHLTSRYREEVASGASVSAGVGSAVKSVGVALTLATFTTAVGFLTNVVNPIPALRDFGVVAAVGIVSAFVLMLTFVPAVRLLLDRRAEAKGVLPRAAFGSSSERVLPGIMARTAVLAERVPVATLLVTVVLGGALGVYGLSRLETRFSSTDFVPEGSPIVATFDEIVERFSGGFGETTQGLLSGPVATAAAHNALVGAHAELAGTEDVSRFGDQAQAESPVTLLEQLLAPGQDGAPSAFAEQAAGLGVQPDLTVAEGSDVAALYTAMRAAMPEATERVVAFDDAEAPELARVAIQTTAGEGRAAALIESLDDVFAPVEATGVDAVATSNPIVNHVIITALQSSQLSSLGVTLLAALVLLVISFWAQHRRPFLGVLTIAPVALVVLWTFGLMAATGIPFGPVTATIAALAIGIGVPYTIHITHRYQEDRRRFADPAEAVRSTVRHTGGALAGSAVTTMTGFGILVTSSLTPFRQFGLVTAYAIGFALLAAAIVLPSMLALWDRWHRRRGDTLIPVVAPLEAASSEREPAGL